MKILEPLSKKDLPKPLSFRKLLGPSFILLGLGLGSGELILWPYLTSKFGLGIIWGALLGITFQFFINMEIERYALVTGESVFVGLARKLKGVSPAWFILSTLVPWIWPGIIASSGALMAQFLGLPYVPYLPIILLLTIGLALTLGPVIYKTQEVFQRTLVLIAVPLIILLVFLLAKPPDLATLAAGLIGRGEGYLFLPVGISLATFLGAFAYSGAGGNLNLAQSYYIKEKGYGMGKFSGRITSILTGKKEKISLEGTTFETTPENLGKFRAWWQRINAEHLIVFWLTGLVTMTLLAFLAYLTVYGQEISQGVGFVISEAGVISQKTLPFLGTFFLILASLMLFSTQFSVMDATSRIMGENLVLLAEKFRIEKLPRYYYFFLWTQILLGIVIFSLGMTEPLTLVVIGAALNAVAMFVYSGLILWLNTTSLQKPLRPGYLRKTLVFLAFLFYGSFSLFTIYKTFFS